MSIAMDYRKSEYEPRGGAEDETSDDATTRVHRLSVLTALLIAGLVLAVFNSGGLVSYTYGLAQSAAGVRALEMTESWHELMREKQLTTVVERIRETVSAARQATWEDLGLIASRDAGEDDGAPADVEGTAGDPSLARFESPGSPSYLSAAGLKHP